MEEFKNLIEGPDWERPVEEMVCSKKDPKVRDNLEYWQFVPQPYLAGKIEIFCENLADLLTGSQLEGDWVQTFDHDSLDALTLTAEWESHTRLSKEKCMRQMNHLSDSCDHHPVDNQYKYGPFSISFKVYKYLFLSLQLEMGGLLYSRRDEVLNQPLGKAFPCP